MGRLGTFVPRLVALTAVWLLATTALTYAAARRQSTAPPAATTAAATTTTPAVLVVPDVRHQAYVFAKGTLGDSGFGWRVVGATKGYPSNTVVSQTPAPGTQVIDTGAPLIVLRLEQSSGKQAGLPEDVSQIRGTAIKLADLAVASVPATTTPTAVTPVAKKPVLKTSLPKKIAVPKRTVPGKRAPLKRPAAFVVPNARREPLDEIPLTRRAAALLAWIDKRPAATDANVKYWLYQHAWIVTGARMGWWHGDAALETLTAVDSRVWNAWGIGAASKAQAESALAFVRAKEGK